MKMQKWLIALGVVTWTTASASAVLSGPEKTEVWTPAPPLVKPGNGQRPPADAIVLFGGQDLREWRMAADPGKPAAWPVSNGILTVGKGTGNIQTSRHFTDYQLHLEWQIPDESSGAGQQRGNSGLFLASTGRGHEGYELQILACEDNPTYVNGQAGSVYKQLIPLANACASGKEWQSYDVVWTAPRFHADGSLLSAAHVTMLHNGVLIQNHVKLAGETVYEGAPSYRAQGAAPIKLQDHGDGVKFRNIWIRPL
ncbi:MAG: DUF1080 domain-containing protein [Pseudomonadota bacterium]